MNTSLEIIIPARNPGFSLAQTARSLARQTDRRFSVLLSDNFSTAGGGHLDEAEQLLKDAGITVRRVRPPMELKRLEHWNWAHAQSQAGWLKPLLPGEQLKPEYVGRLRQRLEQKPNAQFIRCDAEIRTEWGVETWRAPFSGESIGPGDFAGYFPARVNWISRPVNVAYRRTAWAAAGGYTAQLPACAALNLNVILALHHGVDNLAETLVSADELDLNETGAGRVNLWLEMWLVLRQARNYCLAAKLPWTRKWLWAASWAAAMRHR